MASAFSLNRATLIGNLGTDPELRTTQSGTAFCRFNVATSSSYKDKSDQWQDKTEWHRIVLWGRLAERAAQHLRKGSKAYIEGQIETSSYEKDGIKRYTTEIRGDNFIVMAQDGSGAPAPQQYGGGAYQGGQQGGYGGQQGGYGAPQQQAPQGGGYGAPQQQPPTQAPPQEHIQDEFDDDVPF